ncbi:MAG TPA: GerMN domain-containing protein, partial [Anaerolineae bacterium]|nr:GerMN domain-containing protein [Anaerolineae bacterium]
AKGNLADSCTEIDATTIERSGNTFQVKLTTRRPAGQMCAQAVVPYQEIIPLDVADLSAGEYIVNVNGVTDAFTFEVDNTSPKTAPQPITASEITISPNGSTGFSRIKIYLVALDDNGQNGPKIGCGDSLVAVEREITPTLAPLRAAIEELLAVHEQYYGQSGLYNALYQSDLHLENVAIDEHGKATIHLSGSYTLGGVCDTPRFEAQLEETARQFSTVKDVAIFINDMPLEEALSLSAKPTERLMQARV